MAPVAALAVPLAGTPTGVMGLGTLLLAVGALVGGVLVYRRRAGGGHEPTVVEETDPVPLGDDDRVLLLLETHGGRLRQSSIVTETGWSKSKVSTVLSRMHEEGRVTKLRLGRENLICLPGEEPEAVGSPLDR